MNREEVKEIFKRLSFAYPKFEVSTEKIDFWHERLKDQQTETVIKKVNHHIERNPFAPTIAELRTTHPPENKALEEMKRWKVEGQKRIQQEKESGYVRPIPPWEQSNSV